MSDMDPETEEPYEYILTGDGWDKLQNALEAIGWSGGSSGGDGSASFPIFNVSDGSGEDYVSFEEFIERIKDGHSGVYAIYEPYNLPIMYTDMGSMSQGMIAYTMQPIMCIIFGNRGGHLDDGVDAQSGALFMPIGDLKDSKDSHVVVYSGELAFGMIMVSEEEQMDGKNYGALIYANARPASSSSSNAKKEWKLIDTIDDTNRWNYDGSLIGAYGMFTGGISKTRELPGYIEDVDDILIETKITDVKDSGFEREQYGAFAADERACGGVSSNWVVKFEPGNLVLDDKPIYGRFTSSSGYLELTLKINIYAKEQ